MQMLDKLPGETFTRSEFSDVYLRPGGNPRRADIQHEVFEEPAVAAWRKAVEARKVYVCKDGNSGTPNRKPRRPGPRGQTAQG